MSTIAYSECEEVYPRKRVDTTFVDMKVSPVDSPVMSVWGQFLAGGGGVVVGPIWIARMGVAGCMESSHVGCENVLTALSLLVERGVLKKSVSSGLKRQVV